MLRKSALAPSSIAVIRSNANPQEVQRALEESRGQDITVVGRRGDGGPVELTLDLFIARQDSPPQASGAASNSSPVWCCSRVCSWATLRQLRDDALAAANRGTTPDDRCEHCEHLVEFLTHCFERPPVFDRTWSGVMTLNVYKVAHFVNSLLQLGCSSPAKEESVRRHQNHNNHVRAIAAVVSAFLLPDLKKVE